MSTDYGPVPTIDEVGPSTMVDTWCEGHVHHTGEPRPHVSHWRATLAKDVTCEECGATYDDDEWTWECVLPGEPMLVCPCGEQFYLSALRED